MKKIRYDVKTVYGTSFEELDRILRIIGDDGYDIINIQNFRPQNQNDLTWVIFSKKEINE